jgi:leader peptidase (prepilin peptidase)/N-methyltransferase
LKKKVTLAMTSDDFHKLARPNLPLDRPLGQSRVRMEAQNAWIMIIVAPFIGSFLGLLAERLPRGKSVALGRSQCEQCGHVLAAKDLVPIASWLSLRGRCRYCGGNIGCFVLAIELAAIAVAAWAAAETSGWILVASCALGWTLLLLAAIDWQTQLLPDAVTLPLLLAGLAIAYIIMPDAWADHAIGAVAGFAAFAALAYFYKALRGRDGLGLGDAKLTAALGAWVAWQGLPTLVLWASLLGLCWALLRAASGQRLRPADKIPFGPFLAVGGWLVWLYGPLMAPH